MTPPIPILLAAAAAAHHSPVQGPIALELALLGLLLAVGLAIIVQRSLFVVVMFAGVYSLVSAAFFVVLDAVDVAFTEAAVGAGVSTVLMLGAMLLTAREARKTPPGRRWGPLAAVLATGVILLYATKDMPAFGDAESPANAYVGRAYLVRTPLEIGVPNVVTAVLASYRGYDTLGETVVIFTAGLGVMLLLGLRDPGDKRREREPPASRRALPRLTRAEDRDGGEGA
jgi:multicomponent Na+:H+ antiporter subunit B